MWEERKDCAFYSSAVLPVLAVHRRVGCFCTAFEPCVKPRWLRFHFVSGCIQLGMSKQAIAWGLLAGAAGVAAMTATEKLEQTITGRPNSFVPAHTLERLLRRPRKPDKERVAMNWAMHWGQGILLGAVRGWMAEAGVRGPIASFLHLNLRLLNDQTLENFTGVGAPPWTWPVDEQTIDLAGKGIYAFVTGAVADRLIAGPSDRPEPRKSWRDR